MIVVYSKFSIIFNRFLFVGEGGDNYIVWILICIFIKK